MVIDLLIFGYENYVILLLLWDIWNFDNRGSARLAAFAENVCSSRKNNKMNFLV